MKLIDGKKVASELIDAVKEEIKELGATPNIVAIQVGSVPESDLYIQHKKEKALEAGISFTHLQVNEDADPEELYKLIQNSNENENVNGILVQLPIPEKFDIELIKQMIYPWKDVDGFHPLNKGLLESGSTNLIPPTAKGVMSLLKYYDIDPKGKNVTVIGNGEVAGRPTAKLLTNAGATVTVCTEHTKDIYEFTKNADVIVTAVGKERLINKEVVKKDVVLVNIGLTRKVEGVVGDYDYNTFEDIASYSTPTPGGTGPMTVAHLIENTLICYKLMNKIK